MRSSIKYLLTMILGGIIVGSILVATGVNAQNDASDEFETAAPTVVDATLSIDSIFQYQGQLLNSNGTAINGVLPMTFRLYSRGYRRLDALGADQISYSLRRLVHRPDRR